MSFVDASKYISRKWKIKSDDEVVDLLLSQYRGEKEKTVVICCSDTSSGVIDDNKDKLTPYFILPGAEKEKIKQKTKEIPIEFHKQATGLGQIADTINENEDESMSDEGSNSSEELDRIAREKEKEREKEQEKNNNKFYDGSEATFENSIRNKYKRKKTEEIEKKKQNDEKLRATPKYNNYNNKKGKDQKENKDKNTGQFNMKNYARRLSKMNITTTNWNINQLGDIRIYPDVMEIED
jgi:hypothetical protein